LEILLFLPHLRRSLPDQYLLMFPVVHMWKGTCEHLKNIAHLISKQLPSTANVHLSQSLILMNSHEFHDNHYINKYFSDKCFSALHCNIRSLSANRDNLQHMLSEWYLPISIVGLTEIKLKVDQSFLLNTKMPGYSFTFQPSLSSAGGVGFYIKEDQFFYNQTWSYIIHKWLWGSVGREAKWIAT